MLTMTFPDRFEDSDKFNPMATLIYRYFKSPRGITDDYICGPVYISNETIDNTIDFANKDFKYILDKVLKRRIDEGYDL